MTTSDPTDRLLDQIDAAISPHQMSAHAALSVLERLVEELDVRIEGLKGDMAEPAHDHH